MNTLLDVVGLETLLNQNYKDLYSTILVFMLLAIASYFDYKTLKIPNKLNLSFFILRILVIPLIGIRYGNILGLLVGGLLILIPAMIKLKPMGGDIKMVSVIGFYIGFQNVLFLMIFSIFLSAIYYGVLFLRKKELKDIPLAPFIFTAFGILNIVEVIILTL